MELTTDNLIKIAIGVFVIVVIVLGVYFAMRSYIIPYFEGIGFEEPKIDTNSEFGKELIQDKNKIGETNKVGKYDFFIYNGVKTEIYFYKNKLYLTEKGWFGWDWLKGDTSIGSLNNEGKIIINKEIQYSDILNNTYKIGNDIRKIK